MPALRLRPSWLHPPAPQDLGDPVSLLDAAFSLAWVNYGTRRATCKKYLKRNNLYRARRFAVESCFMDATQINAYLQGINMQMFSQTYKVPLRTLSRVKAGKSTTRQATLDMLSKAIRKDQRKAERAAA